MTQVLEVIETIEVTVEDDTPKCFLWHDVPEDCQQTPEFIGWLVFCKHAHAACRRHYNIFEFGRLRYVVCGVCGTGGYNIDMDWAAL